VIRGTEPFTHHTHHPHQHRLHLPRHEPAFDAHGTPSVVEDLRVLQVLAVGVLDEDVGAW
jgi:hypothetical protein